jgi:hypothetical protein
MNPGAANQYWGALAAHEAARVTAGVNTAELPLLYRTQATTAVSLSFAFLFLFFFFHSATLNEWNDVSLMLTGTLLENPRSP